MSFRSRMTGKRIQFPSWLSVPSSSTWTRIAHIISHFLSCATSITPSHEDKDEHVSRSGFPGTIERFIYS